MSAPPLSVVVTGAGTGIGRAVSRVFLDRGDRVLLVGRNPVTLETARRELGHPDRSVAVSADVGVAADRARLVAAAVEAFGGVDVLVNNAGVFGTRPFLEVDEEELDRFLRTNLKGTFFTSQAVVPHMLRAGGGSIVNIGTVLVNHAIGGVPCTAAMAAKGGIHAITVQLAAEFGRSGIRVNTVAPGIIRTPLHTAADVDTLAGLHLVDRIGEPEAVARMVLDVATNEFVTGAIVPVDGGHVAGHHMT